MGTVIKFQARAVAADPTAHAAACCCAECRDERLDAELADLDRFDRFAFVGQVGVMTERLKKLPVADLRVLARHYFGRYFDAEDMSKAELIAEIAPEIVNSEEF